MEKYQLIVDSCCDITNEMLDRYHIQSVPLTLHVNGSEFRDDRDLNTKDLLQAIADADSPGKSSCPSPDEFLQTYDAERENFVITLSGAVSGSYNSAELAKRLFLEEHPDAKIHIVDSHSAAAAEVALCHRLLELFEQDLSFEEIVRQITAYRDELTTLFILDDMDNLIKNGRIRGLKAFLVGRLNIKAIMTQKDGEIVQAGMGRGLKKALANLAKMIDTESLTRKAEHLFITHINAPDTVETLLSLLKCKDRMKSIVINEGRGLSSFYAMNGGLIVAF